jgi:cytochrome c-type biogenesis protein CcmF
MNLGDLLLKLAFVGALVAVVAFLGPLRGRKDSRLGEWAFAAHGLLLVAAMVLLGGLFVAHRFEYEYVAHYSSRALSPAMSLAASWAGQEGSILLWSMIGGLLGLALLRQPGSLTRPAMFFVSLAQGFLTVLLLVKSPFGKLPAALPDGQGLNPLLEDPWMIIHPPVLFVGYAALVVPFGLAAAALARREYRDWDRMVWPWALFAVVFLGAGIGLGGVWAYKVLGWGGYWGWDPVENASLIPWLVTLALLHGLLIQRATGAAVRTNLALALLGWVTVLGGTYMTRSGVLQNFSVHSFTDSGLNAPLTSFLGVTFLIGLGLLAVRWRSIESPRSDWLAPSREAALWTGLWALLALAILVSVGTTAPLTTTLMGRPASMQTRFYEGIIVWLGLAVLALLAIAPALRASRQEAGKGPAPLIAAAVLGVLAVAGGAAAGIRQPMFLVLAAVTGAALGANLWAAMEDARRGWRQMAGHLGHVGVAVMALGMVVSTALTRSEQVRLPQGAAVRALGYTLTYRGQQSGPRPGEQLLRVRVERGGFRFDASPRLLPSPMGDGMMRSPAIHGLRDLYLTPLEVQPGPLTDEDVTWLETGREVEVGGATYRLAGFRTVSQPPFAIYADVDVRTHGGPSVRLSPGVREGSGGSESLPAEVPGLGRLELAGMDRDRGRAALLLPGSAAAPADVVLVDFSTKPLVNLVWIGALLTLVATVLAAVRRAQERALARGRRGREAVPEAR